MAVPSICNLARGLFLLVSFLCVPTALCQSDESPPPEWDRELVGRLSASQAAYSNWQEGGLNQAAVTASMNGQFEREDSTWTQSYDTRFVLGVVKQDTLSFRKAEDALRLSASFQNAGRGLFATFNPTVSAKLRTQFAPGYNYDRNPFEGRDEVPVKVSDFFAPATLTQSVGLTYDLDDWFTQRIGIGGKQTIVHLRRLRPLYGLTRDEIMRPELGLESQTEIEREITDNIYLSSSLGLFAALNKDVPDLLWETQVDMRVNQWLGANLEFAALYDRNISTRVQFKQVFSLGVSVAML